MQFSRFYSSFTAFPQHLPPALAWLSRTLSEIKRTPEWYFQRFWYHLKYQCSGIKTCSNFTCPRWVAFTKCNVEFCIKLPFPLNCKMFLCHWTDAIMLISMVTIWVLTVYSLSLIFLTGSLVCPCAPVYGLTFAPAPVHPYRQTQVGHGLLGALQTWIPAERGRVRKHKERGRAWSSRTSRFHWSLSDVPNSLRSFRKHYWKRLISQLAELCQLSLILALINFFLSFYRRDNRFCSWFL